MRQIHVITVNKRRDTVYRERINTLMKNGGYKTNAINITVLSKGGRSFTFIHKHQKSQTWYADIY